MLNASPQREVFRFLRLTTLLSALWGAAAVLFGSAHAATATYVEPGELSDADLAALSSAGDGSGYLLGLGETLAFVLDPPVAGDTRQDISIFTAAPSQGNAIARISFGVYNNGDPTIVASRNVVAGNSVNIGNLLQNGCQLLGGCDYIEIVTTRVNGGASGVEIDYVLVDGEVVEVASPTPEPSAWMLMIVAFAAVAARLKTLRARRWLKPSSAFPQERRSRLSPMTARRRTAHP